MSKINQAAHIKHAGVMIDASFNRGQVEYYVVQGSGGRFKHLSDAKAIATAIAARSIAA